MAGPQVRDERYRGQYSQKIKRDTGTKDDLVLACDVGKRLGIKGQILFFLGLISFSR
jgi:hypothetical protein